VPDNGRVEMRMIEGKLSAVRLSEVCIRRLVAEMRDVNSLLHDHSHCLILVIEDDDIDLFFFIINLH
jgi:hypothetical protein